MHSFPSFLSQRLKANSQLRLLSSILRLFRLTSHFLLLTFLFVLPAFSQPGWEKTYGGSGDDGGYSVQQTTDRGYIVTGYTHSFGSSNQVYLLKTDSLGDTLWTRTYEGAGGTSVQQTSDGGYIVTGGILTNGNDDVLLIKTDASGDTLWTRHYGGDSVDIGYSVQQTMDGGYIVAGFTFSYGAGIDDVYLIKTDSLGDTLWTRVYGGPGYEVAYSVRQTSDGGYIVAGFTTSYGVGYSDVYLIKTKANGDTLWTRAYGGTRWDEGESVKQTSDGNYIVAGSTQSFGAKYSAVYLLKVKPQGDTLWTKTYGGTGFEEGYSCQQTTDGGYIITGRTSPYGAGPNWVYLVKTDSTGALLWSRSYGGTGDQWGMCVQQTTDGGYIIGGYTNSYGAGDYDVYLIKTDSNGYVGVEGTKSRKQKAEGGIKAAPNPFVSYATVPGHEKESFALYDITGRVVGTYKGDRIGAGLPAGVYFLRPDSKEAKPLRVVKLR